MWKFLLLLVLFSYSAHGQIGMFTYFDHDSLKIGQNKAFGANRLKLELLDKNEYAIEESEGQLLSSSIFYVTSYDTTDHLSSEYLLFRLTNNSNENFYVPSFLSGFVILEHSTGYDYMMEIGGYYKSKFGDVIIEADSVENTVHFKTYSIIENNTSKRKMKSSHFFLYSIKCWLMNLFSKNELEICKSEKISRSISPRKLTKLKELGLAKPINIKVTLPLKD